jgi:non-ribosomal peptide synthetase component F
MSLTRYELPELRVSMSGLGAERGTSKFDLYLAMIEDSEGLGGTLEYNTDLFDAASMSRMISYFEALLKEVAENPDGELDALSLMDEQDSNQLIYDFNE